MRVIRMPGTPHLYLDFTWGGKRHKISTYSTSMPAARKFADRIEYLIEMIQGDEPFDAATRRWISDLSPARRQQLGRIGLLKGRKREKKGLAKLVDRYEQTLRNTGMREADVKSEAQRCRRIFEAADIKTVDDFTADPVQDKLAQLRADGITAATSNRYLARLKAFGNWLIREGHIEQNPLRHVRKLVEDQDTRRALTPEEQTRLLETTREGLVRYGQTGEQRYWLYRFALETGLRAGEIRRVRLADFNWRTPTVAVQPKAGQSRPKARELVHQPLAKKFAAELHEHLSNREPGEPAFKVPHKAARMLEQDLTAAGIPKQDDADRVVVFHSLRHTFGTNLALVNTPPAVAQQLMRHKTIAMTMQLYTHIPSDAAQAAVEALSGLQTSHRGSVVST